MKIFILALAGLLLIIPSTQARPVSYPGGKTVMLTNNGDRNAVHLHYSPTAKYSVGYKGEYWRADDYALHAVQVNNLLKRWNEKDSQANFYLKSGAGLAHSYSGVHDGDTELAGFTGIALDWEDRRFFTSYENRYTYAGDIADFYTQSARVGVAPYIGDYGDLHTWLMLEAEHQPEAEDHIKLTPMVRFFKGVHPVEAGMNEDGDVLFNWFIRY